MFKNALHLNDTGIPQSTKQIHLERSDSDQHLVDAVFNGDEKLNDENLEDLQSRFPSALSTHITQELHITQPAQHCTRQEAENQEQNKNWLLTWSHTHTRASAHALYGKVSVIWHSLPTRPARLRPCRAFGRLEPDLEPEQGDNPARVIFWT